VGRFFAVDPLAKKYPHNSPYAFSENNVIAFVELEGLEKATPEMTQRAIIAILIFRNNGKKGKWSNISRNDFANSLLKIVRNSNLVHQQNTNLCGNAVVVKAMIDYDPESFVNLAIGLFEDGEAESLSFFHENLYANEDLYGNTPTNNLDNASYVIMPSMRHSYNLSDYDPTTDTGLAGVTYPGDIPDIATNFANMKDVSWDYTHDVAGLNKALNDGATIIALFDIEMLKNGVPDNNILRRTFGSHYVIINSISQNGQNITVNYWNYGDTSASQSQETLTKAKYDEAIKNYIILNSD
jgi:hypothetical protein